jgi:hypothetical protein
MSTYNPEVKIFYGEFDNNDHKLIPSPDISISIEYNYSNDTIIGYSYIFNLKGYASALDLRDLDNNDPIPSSPPYGAGAVIDQIHKIRKILSQNGSILHIVDGQNNYILKAKGGILRSFSIDESSNNWVHFANYTASIEFHSVDFGSKIEDCDTIFLDPATYNTDGLLDINKFKIKSFNDSWSITFDENEAFARIKNNENNINLNIDNHGFNIQYTISATGKHFFNYSDEATSEAKLLPAWEQAKNFVQYRLYNQVTNLINNILKDSYNSSCSSSDGLDDILQPGGGSGLLKGLNTYKIFNEQITCDTSESEGSFSATYSAIVKSTRGNSGWTSSETKHIITKSVTRTNNIGSQTVSINVNGTIEGLIEGGLIRINEPLRLPEKGSILINNTGSNNKYLNAKSLLDKIYSDSDYGSGLGENGKRDLKLSFKNALNITLPALGINGPPNNNDIPDPPHPNTFNLTHNYNAGTITYSAEYSSKQGTSACGKKFNEISIQTTNPIKILATFNIPNSNSCPVIQELGTYTNKTVNLTIQGIDTSEVGQPTNLSVVNEVLNTLNVGCYDEGYLPISLPPPGTYIITQKQYTRNPLDGSFSINMTYICNGNCSI